MTLFDAIYGDAFAAVEKLLERTPMTAGQLRAAGRIPDPGWGDGGGAEAADGSWPLLQRDAQGLCESALPPLHARQLTTLELRWLRSLCDDARAPLFLTDAQLDHLRDALADVPPIFEAGEIESFDAIRSGDDFADPNYPPSNCAPEALPALVNRSYGPISPGSADRGQRGFSLPGSRPAAQVPCTVFLLPGSIFCILPSFAVLPSTASPFRASIVCIAVVFHREGNAPSQWGQQAYLRPSRLPRSAPALTAASFRLPRRSSLPVGRQQPWFSWASLVPWVRRFLPRVTGDRVKAPETWGCVTDAIRIHFRINATNLFFATWDGYRELYHEHLRSGTAR